MNCGSQPKLIFGPDVAPLPVYEPVLIIPVDVESFAKKYATYLEGEPMAFTSAEVPIVISVLVIDIILVDAVLVPAALVFMNNIFDVPL
jgi:hypothetical protein